MLVSIALTIRDQDGTETPIILSEMRR